MWENCCERCDPSTQRKTKDWGGSKKMKGGTGEREEDGEGRRKG